MHVSYRLAVLHQVQIIKFKSYKSSNWKDVEQVPEVDYTASQYAVASTKTVLFSHCTVSFPSVLSFQRAVQAE